jgi:phospholipase C
VFEVLAPFREILNLIDKSRAVQPVDFFGTGPRIPMIAVSPFSRGGHITHV